MSGIDNISNEEIIRDISDTWNEIFLFEREEKGFRIIGDRWSIMRADHRAQGIIERKEFIKKLENILKERESK